jgi:hypothetical protein
MNRNQKLDERCAEIRKTIFWQTRYRGTNEQEFENYLACADDGTGLDFTTGKPLKTFDEWMAT